MKSLLLASLLLAAPPTSLQVVEVDDARAILEIVQDPKGSLLLAVQGSTADSVGARTLSNPQTESRVSEQVSRTPRFSDLAGKWTGHAVAFREDGSIAASLTDARGHRWWVGWGGLGDSGEAHRLTRLRHDEQIETLWLEPDGTLVGLGSMAVPGPKHPNLWHKRRIFHLDVQGLVDNFQVQDPELDEHPVIPVVHADRRMWFYRMQKGATLARWDPRGARDTSFKGQIAIPDARPSALAMLPTGELLTALRGTVDMPGPGTSCGNDADRRFLSGVFTLGPDGSVREPILGRADEAQAGMLRIESMHPQPDGGLLLVGQMELRRLLGTPPDPSCTDQGERPWVSIARLDPQGKLDEPFTRRWQGVEGVRVVQPLMDGRVAVGGGPLRGSPAVEGQLLVIVPGAGGDTP